MTTSGVTTNCNVDDQDVDITAPYDHIIVGKDEDEASAVDEQADQVTEVLAAVADVDEATVALSPDGGWGWMVVGAAFVSNLIVGGVCYMFGIIMPELLEYFEAGKGKTAFVGSVVPGTLSIVGKSISRQVPSILSPLQYWLSFFRRLLGYVLCPQKKPENF